MLAALTSILRALAGWNVPPGNDAELSPKPTDSMQDEQMKQRFDQVFLSDIPNFVQAQVRRVYTLFIHCSASDREADDNAETMHRWHKERGWREIGYHLFIQKDGTMQLGRDWNQVPAAQRGHNDETLAICLHGLDEDKFTREQLNVMVDFCQRLDEQFEKQKGYHLVFRGHCEVAAKLCPVIDYATILGLDSLGYLGTAARPEPGKKPVVKDKVFAPGTVRLFDRGDDVRRAQVLLNIEEIAPRLEEDGVFGRATLYAVRTFQARNGLRPDGIIGPNTWKLLRAKT